MSSFLDGQDLLDLTEADTGTTVSKSIDTRSVNGLSIQVVNVGLTLTAITLEETNETAARGDIQGDGTTDKAGNWTDTGVTFAGTSEVVKVSDFRSRYARIKSVFSSGTGTLNVHIVGKGSG